MKESRFIELLNLYVDQQLTAAEATELEKELQRDPSRRQTYQQYCRMQKACVQLFEKERQTAPSTSKLSRALAEADRKVIAFPETRVSWTQRGAYAFGVAAAAACVALVFFRSGNVTPQNVASESAKPEAAPAVVAVAASESTMPVATTQVVAIPPADPQTREMRKFYFAGTQAKRLLPVSAIRTNGEHGLGEERLDFSWMKNMEFEPLKPVNVGNYIPDSTDQPQVTTLKFIDSRHQAQTPSETTAFQFSKGN